MSSKTVVYLRISSKVDEILEAAVDTVCFYADGKSKKLVDYFVFHIGKSLTTTLHTISKYYVCNFVAFYLENMIAHRNRTPVSRGEVMCLYYVAFKDSLLPPSGYVDYTQIILCLLFFCVVCSSLRDITITTIILTPRTIVQYHHFVLCCIRCVSTGSVRHQTLNRLRSCFVCFYVSNFASSPE